MICARNQFQRCIVVLTGPSFLGLGLVSIGWFLLSGNIPALFFSRQSKFYFCTIFVKKNAHAV